MTSLDTLNPLDLTSNETISLVNDTTSIKSYSSTSTTGNSSTPSVASESSKDRDNDDHEYILPLSPREANLPDVTLRGLILGLLIGSVMAFTNTYFGLQTGWISMMSLQSSLIGYGLGKLADLSKLNPLHKGLQYRNLDQETGIPYPNQVYRWYDLSLPFGIKENVLIQTTAVATATMPLAGGFVGIIPALKLLTPEELPNISNLLGTSKLEFTTTQLLIWGLGLGFFGVFLAVPLRNQVILREKLKFPSGTATAQMIQLLHKKTDTNLDLDITTNGHVASTNKTDQVEEDIKFQSQLSQQWYALSITFTLSSLTTIFTNYFPTYNELPIFDFLIPVASKWDWYLTPALSYLGQGIIMGLSTCLSMSLGAIVGWLILAPLSSYMGWAPGQVNDWKDGPRGWILWISLAIMISESTVSLSLICFKELKSQYLKFSLRSNSNHSNQSNGEDPNQMLPNWALYYGLTASSILCVLSINYLFDQIPLYSIIISLLLGGLLSVLAVRALGETDLNPVSGIGKVSQIAFGALLPNNLVGNLVAGGVAEAGAMQAGDMMQDLKTGHLLNASPRAQFLGQLVGSLVSVFVSVFAYQIFTSQYEIPSKTFPVPTAQIWLDMARLVNGHPLPPKVLVFCILFALLFALIPILKYRYAGQQWTKYLPSGIAFAIGIYNPPYFTLPRLLGAVLAEIYLNGYVSKVWNKLVLARNTDVQFRRYDASSQSFILNQGSPHLNRIKDNELKEEDQKFYKVLVTVIASGLVLGEGTTAITLLLAKVLWS